MQLALILSIILIVLFVCLSDFSNINLDDNTEKLLYVSDNDDSESDYNDQIVDDSQQPDLNDFESSDMLNNTFAEFEETPLTTEFGDVEAMQRAEDLINQIYGK